MDLRFRWRKRDCLWMMCYFVRVWFWRLWRDRLKPREVRTLRWVGCVCKGRVLIAHALFLLGWMCLEFFRYQDCSLPSHLVLPTQMCVFISVMIFQTNIQGYYYMHTRSDHFDHTLDTDWACLGIRGDTTCLSRFLPKLLHGAKTKFVRWVDEFCIRKRYFANSSQVVRLLRWIYANLFYYLFIFRTVWINRIFSTYHQWVWDDKLFTIHISLAHFFPRIAI